MHLRRNVSFLVATGLLLVSAAGTFASDDGVATLGSPEPDAPGATSPAAPADSLQAFVDFVACMREHGVDLPDPVVIGDDGGSPMWALPGEILGGSDESGGPDDEFVAAQTACADLLQAAMPEVDLVQQQEMLEQQLAHAQCMRDHGVDTPDPMLGDDGGVVQLFGEGSTGSDVYSDAFQTASEACNAEMGGGFGRAIEPAP